MSCRELGHVTSMVTLMSRKKAVNATETVLMSNLPARLLRISEASRLAGALRIKSSKTKSAQALRAWELDFSNTGEDDLYETLGGYLRLLRDEQDFVSVNSRWTGKLAATYTRELVTANLASLELNGFSNKQAEFLKQQRYVKSGQSSPNYVFTFYNHDGEFGILRGNDLSLIDLAGLYLHQLEALKINGYSDLVVCRADGGSLDTDLVEGMILDAFRDEFSNDELRIGFSHNLDFSLDPTMTSVNFDEPTVSEIADERCSEADRQ